MASTDVLTSANGAVQTSLANVSLSASNATAALLTTTSAKDVALFPLRLIAKADHFLFTTLPQTIAQSTGLNALADRAISYFRTGEAAAAGGAGGVARAADAAGGTWTDMSSKLSNKGPTRDQQELLGNAALHDFKMGIHLSHHGFDAESYQCLCLVKTTHHVKLEQEISASNNTYHTICWANSSAPASDTLSDITRLLSVSAWL